MAHYSDESSDEESEELDTYFLLYGQWLCNSYGHDFSSKFSVKRHISRKHKGLQLSNSKQENTNRAFESTVFEPEILDPEMEETSNCPAGDIDDDADSCGFQSDVPHECSDVAYFEDGQFSDGDKMEMSSVHNFSSATSSEYESESDLSVSEDDTNTFLYSSSNTNNHERVITVSEHKKFLLAYATKHNLSQLQDLLQLLKVHIPRDSNACDRALAVYNGSMNTGADELGIKRHDYCEKCLAVFPLDANEYKCATPLCGGLRYKGSESEQNTKRKKSYFVSLDIKQQLADLLNRDGVWQSIQEQYEQRHKDENMTCIRDITDGKEYQKHCGNGGFLSNKSNISFLCNSDGITLFVSSGVGLWPVFLVINELPPQKRFLLENVVLWGLWQGRGKPCMHAFLKPFIQDMKSAKEEGFFIKPRSSNSGHEETTVHVHAMLLLCTLDLQGRAYFMNMTHHNGRCSCNVCEESGYTVPSGKGYSACIPFSDNMVFRTHNSFVENAKEAHVNKSTVKGVKGLNMFLALQWFDVVKGFAIDYMHGVLLGVTKTLLTLWFSRVNIGKEYYIGNQIEVTDKRLLDMKPPDYISCTPRSLDVHLQKYKASELKTWLLFYAIPCLKDILPSKFLDHFALLVEGMHILLATEIPIVSLERADMVMSIFCKDFRNLYDG